MISRRVLLSVAVASGIGIATNVRAQSYPDKPIKLVVPFPPGGPIDTMARLVAQGMSSNLGQQVVVENRPGAGSTIGSKAVASADPDGYTLLFGSSGSLGVAPALYASVGLDPVKSFAPVASVSLLPHVVVVPASLPAKTVQEFVAYAKANPGKLNFGAGLGTPPHLLGALFKSKAEIDITYIPYKGAAQSVTDLLGGQTHFTIDGTLILMPHIKAGKLRAIGVGRPQRWHELPEVPTMTESGYPDFTIDAWTGVVAPAGTPPQIIEKLNGAVNAGLLSPETETAMARFSSITKIGTPEEFAAFIASEAPRWAAMVKLANAKVE
jgi:tripartite-type tricarboxylate transporter receptor subunit TctC